LTFQSTRTHLSPATLIVQRCAPAIAQTWISPPPCRLSLVRKFFVKNYISTPRHWRKFTTCPTGKRKQVFTLGVFMGKFSSPPQSIADARRI